MGSLSSHDGKPRSAGILLPKRQGSEACGRSVFSLWKCAAALSFCLLATCSGTASAASRLSVIYSFLGLSDGARVFDNPLLKDGKLYVTTTYGGYVKLSPFSPGYGGEKGLSFT
jgi:hypothetical protein